MTIDREKYLLKNPGVTGKRALALGIIGVAASLIGYYLNPEQFFHSYLVAYEFWLTLALGALFFVMLHHLVSARWSIVLRRLSETIAQIIPFMAVLFIPILIGLPYLYEWSHKESVAADALLRWKSSYLNVIFFIIRAVFYFAVWSYLARRLYKISLEQDKGFKEEQVRKFRLISAPGIIIYGLTVTFAAFDWLMSLDAHWYSTIFGVYIFGGSVVGIIAIIIVLAVYLRQGGILSDCITIEHYHDLGKLLFAFMVFWAYIAFSQYFLIWYANIPEETIWFSHRWVGSWKTLSLLIVFGHFVVPFFILITRGIKRNPLYLGVMALWMLIMHWVDLYWVVLPGLHHEGVLISWIDFAPLLAIGGLCVWYFWRLLSSQPLVPAGDPRLEDSIKLTIN
jgi:hypothetical protein